MAKVKQSYVLWPDPEERRRVWDNLRAYLRTLPTDKAIRITIEDYRKPKTLEQRGWFHRLCELWGDEIGLTKGQCKEIVKGHHFGWRMVRVAGIDFPVADGSSEDEDRLGYSTLIESTYRLAAEGGVMLPEADRWRKAG